MKEESIVMKKLLIIALVLILALSVFAGCGKVTQCEGCGQTKNCKQVTYNGESAWLCTDTCAPIAEAAIKGGLI